MFSVNYDFPPVEDDPAVITITKPVERNVAWQPGTRLVEFFLLG